MVPAGNKAKRLSSVNHTTKTIQKISLQSKISHLLESHHCRGAILANTLSLSTLHMKKVFVLLNNTITRKITSLLKESFIRAIGT